MICFPCICWTGYFKTISIFDMHRDREGLTDDESQMISVQDREGE